jgi:FAD/FMN-containing dehydrogenase
MSLIDSLVGVFSGKIIREPHDMAAYLTDWRGKWTGVAIAVVQPDSTEDVASVVRWCHEHSVSIVPQGGNTGLSGGATPSATGLNVVLSLTRMNKVREIDVLNNTISLDAGVTLLSVQQAAEDVQKLFPLSLAAEGTCTIGGNLATNAGGVQVLRYGNTRDLCLGLEVVTADGSVWNGMKSLRKDNTGYDLKNIFIGSEGTLGVITGATFKLFEKPKSKVVSFIALADPSAALRLLKLAQELYSNELTAFELMSDECIRLVEKHVDAARLPLTSRSDWYVLLELSASCDEQALIARIESLLEIAMQNEWIADAAISSSMAQFNAIWSLREDISEAQAAEGKTIKHDISLPISVIPQFIEQVTQQLLDRFSSIRMVVFGHLGDGNLHFNLSPVSSLEKSQIDAFTGIEAEVNKLVHDAVNALRGSISAEHGLGVLRRDEASRYRSETEQRLMETLKKSLDPKNLMNPGKVIS